MCKHFFENPVKDVEKTLSKPGGIVSIGSDVIAALTGNPEIAYAGNTIGGALSNTGNPILGAAEGLGESYLGAQAVEGIGQQVGLSSGPTIGNDFNSLTSGVSNALDSAGNAIDSSGNYLNNLFNGGSEQTAGSALTDSGTSTANGINAQTGTAVAGTSPTISGGVTGGGFAPASTQLATNSDPGISSQLGGTQAVTGSTTPGATSLGTVGADTAEPGTASNFEPNSGLTGSTANSGIEAAGGGNLSSGGLESGGALSNVDAATVNNALSSPAAPPDSLGVSGGVAPSASTGASNVASSQFSDLNTIGTSSGSSPDFGSQITSALTNPANLKYALPAGELINTLIQGPQKLPSNAQPLTAGGAVEGPLQATETQSLNAYNSQTLTPGQQAQIDQYTQQAQNALYQQLAGAGVTNPAQDSRYIQGMQQIQQQAESMKQQLLQTDLSAGTGAAGQAAEDLSATAQMQNQSDEEYQQSIQEAIQAFGQLEGGNSISAASINKLLNGSGGGLL